MLYDKRSTQRSNTPKLNDDNVFDYKDFAPIIQ